MEIVRLDSETALPCATESVELTPPSGVSELEARLTAHGIDTEALKERLKLDRCISTNDRNIFEFANQFISSGEIHADGMRRPIARVTITPGSDIRDPWVQVYRELTGETVPLDDVVERLSKWIGAQRTFGRAGLEPFHMAINLEVATIPNLREFLGDFHAFLTYVEVMNEFCELTYAIRCDFPRLFLPKEIHDTIWAHEKIPA